MIPRFSGSGATNASLASSESLILVIANSTHSVKSSGVICFVYDTVTGTSECHIIDAKRLEDDPVARIKITQGVPHGFHASRVAD